MSLEESTDTALTSDTEFEVPDETETDIMDWRTVQRMLARNADPSLLPPDFFGPGFPPAKPTSHLPGTDGKIAVLTRRYARREQLHHPHDAR
jgi:hypothetical protein